MTAHTGASKKDKGIGLLADPLDGSNSWAVFVEPRKTAASDQEPRYTWISWCHVAPDKYERGRTPLDAANTLFDAYAGWPGGSRCFVLRLSRVSSGLWRATCPCGWKARQSDERDEAALSGATHWQMKHRNHKAPDNATVEVGPPFAPKPPVPAPNQFSALVKRRSGAVVLVRDGKTVSVDVDLPKSALNPLVGLTVQFRVVERRPKQRPVVLPVLYEGSTTLQRVVATLRAAGHDSSRLEDIAKPKPPPPPEPQGGKNRRKPARR